MVLLGLQVIRQLVRPGSIIAPRLTGNLMFEHICTPQRAPLETMERSRLQAVSLNEAGNLAMTRKRCFSAIVPACWLYSVMLANSSRRYIWMTFSI